MKLAESIKDSIVLKLSILVLIPWGILAIIFAFTDLAISKAVIDQESVWGNFGADYGEGPGYGLIGIAIAILIGNKNNDLKKQKLPALIIGILTLILMIVGIVINESELAIVSGFIGIPVLIFTILTYEKDWKEYRTIATVVFLLAILNPLLLVQTIKVIWGRVRPRDVLAGQGEFTPWYVINGYTGNHSFPSGHTAMGWMFLPLLILVRDREWKDPIKILLWIAVFGWGIFVAASRVVVGAHFASDVLFSTGFAAIITILLYYIYYIKK
ncbi:MAG: phosphatase PAP2 family protein [Promethearchaeota archaeon]